VFLRDFGKKYDGIYDTPIKKFIKGNINEVKIQPAGINFTFPFWITKQNKSQAPFIADQLNKQGYTLKGDKFTEEDITFNIPTILDYDSNYRDQPERKILNTYSPSSEVKIQPPLTYKKAYGEVHSYNEMKKWQEQNGELPSHFLVDRTNNTVLAGFQAMNIPKWAWDLQNDNNMFALASKSSITNPPPYLNNPNIDVTNPASWGDINKVKKYIKNNVNEVKIKNPVVDLDQKIKDIADNIIDYIEFLYDRGDKIESNKLSETMDNIERAYKFDYSDLSLKNMNFKKKIELYKELKDIQEELK